MLAVLVGGLVLHAGGNRAQPPPGPGWAADSTVAVPAGAQAAVVRRSVDGDTVVLTGIGAGPLAAGRSQTVRLLEVDTPEVYGRKDCYGVQASAFAARLLPVGARVHVAVDRERQDRYGRTLLYVWTQSGLFVEQVVAREGYARAVLYPPNDRYIAVVRAAADSAAHERRGVWACDPLPPRFR